MTDSAGQYEFKELPAGRYSLTVTRNGYVSSGYGVQPPSQLAPQPLTLSAGQTLDRVGVVMSRGGVAVVTVTDAEGEPLAGLEVTVLQPRIVNGERSLGTSGTAAESNDLGRARVFGLMPGEYYVSAQPALGSANRTMPRTYYPGTLTVEGAQPVQIIAGQETHVVVPIVSARLARVSGVVRTSQGPPLRPGDGTGLTLSLRQISAGGSYTSGIVLRPDGSFDVRDLPPGRIELVVGPPLGSAAAAAANPLREFARVPLNIDGADIAGLVVTTGPGASISGRLVFDTGKPPEAVTPQMLRVLIGPTGNEPSISTGQTTMHDDFSFDLDGVASTGLLRIASLSTGWFVKSVALDGKDITNTPTTFDSGRRFKDVEVVLTQKRATVAGQALDGQSRAATNFAVVLFPEDRQFWYVRSPLVFVGRSDQTGAFKIEGVPEGRYLAVAVDRLLPNEQQSPDLLARLAPRASSVAVRDGESKSISLRLEAR